MNMQAPRANKSEIRVDPLEFCSMSRVLAESSDMLTGEMTIGESGSTLVRDDFFYNGKTTHQIVAIYNQWRKDP
jgi:hypothetical protein